MSTSSPATNRHGNCRMSRQANCRGAWSPPRIASRTPTAHGMAPATRTGMPTATTARQRLSTSARAPTRAYRAHGDGLRRTEPRVRLGCPRLHHRWPASTDTRLARPIATPRASDAQAPSMSMVASALSMRSCISMSVGRYSGSGRLDQLKNIESHLGRGIERAGSAALGEGLALRPSSSGGVDGQGRIGPPGRDEVGGLTCNICYRSGLFLVLFHVPAPHGLPGHPSMSARWLCPRPMRFSAPVLRSSMTSRTCSRSRALSACFWVRVR